jgi:hypothetical protein
MTACWYERTHSAANMAPRWTWADVRGLLRDDRGGHL